MSKKNSDKNTRNFESRIKNARQIILDTASKNLDRIEEVYSFVPTIDLAAIELAKVELTSTEIKTSMVVTIDSFRFFDLVFQRENTIIEVEDFIRKDLSDFFDEISNKIGAILHERHQTDYSQSFFDSTRLSLPVELSEDTQSYGQITSSDVKVVDLSAKASLGSRPSKTIKVTWDSGSSFRQVEAYLSQMFGYKDCRQLTSNVSLVGFREDTTVTCVLNKNTSLFDGEEIHEVLNMLFNDEKSPIGQDDGSAWRIVVTKDSGEYHNGRGLCKNGLNRYLFNGLEPAETNFIQEMF